MSTAVLNRPVEQQAAALSLVEQPKPLIETVATDEGNPLTPVVIAFVLAFIGSTAFVGLFAAWIYALRYSGVWAP
jgi:hypothetical protein